MKIKIVVFGKTADSATQQLIDEYTKRIQIFSKVEIIVLPEEKIAKTISEQQLKTRESERFWKVYDDQSFLISCDVRGKRMTSELFAKHMGDVSVQYPSVTFVVGGSLGIGEDILKKSHLRISFSDMTFPHDLFRIFLLEQIYRGFMILNRRKYHR